MYAQLLDAAFDSLHPGGDESPVGVKLAELLQCRSRLGAEVTPPAGSGWAPDAVADQLAYDVALVDLARAVGIDCDISRFDRPLSERTRLEQALAARGIELDNLDGGREVAGRAVASNAERITKQ